MIIKNVYQFCEKRRVTFTKKEKVFNHSNNFYQVFYSGVKMTSIQLILAHTLKNLRKSSKHIGGCNFKKYVFCLRKTLLTSECRGENNKPNLRRFGGGFI